MSCIRVCIADALPILREGLFYILQREADIEVVGVAKCTMEATASVREFAPDVLLLGVNSSDEIQRVSALFSSVKCLILAPAAGETQVRSTFHAGARGFALKQLAAPDLVQAVRLVANDQIYVDAALAARLLASHPQQTDVLSGLSHREAQVLTLVAQGLSNKEVGRQLLLTEKTVKHYVTNMLQKLQVRNRVQAALLMRAEHHFFPALLSPEQPITRIPRRVHAPAL
jgi:two-component system, NarL family, nitrate/nitrite response regulator NarL